MINTPEREIPTRIIRSRARREAAGYLFAAGLAVVLQFMCAASFLLPAMEQTMPPPRTWLGRVFFPFGWVALVLVVLWQFRRRRLLRDLDGPPVSLAATVISKAPLQTNFDTGEPDEDQYITIYGRSGRFVVPLATWSELPEPQCIADCVFLKHSRVVCSIDVRKERQDRQSAPAN